MRDTNARKRRWSAVGLFAVAVNATCSGPKIDHGGESASRRVVDDDVEVRRSALVEPSIAVPAPLATEPYGRLPGGGGVSVDGTYTYSVPIEVPPGRAGMQPTLALGYSSRGGYGAVGMGWQVGGLSTISRCAKVPASGGFRKGIDFMPSDDYCLDGMRLAKIKGTQGAVNSEYRTEADIHAKIVITRADLRGPREWTVYTRNGRIGTYTKPTSETWTMRHSYNADGTIKPPSEDVDLSWPIVKETDRSYNRIDYKYTMSDAAGTSFTLPHQIEYTKCDALPCAYPDAQIRRVEFKYTPLPQGVTYLTANTNGVFQSLMKLLNEVVVSVQTTGTTFNVVRKYKLRHVQSPLTKRFLLKGIKLCDKLDVCIPETSFDWTAETGLSHQIKGGDGTGAPNYVVRLASLGGNRDEMLPPDSGIVAFDADGDGNDDLLLKEWTGLDVNNRVVDTSIAFDSILLGDGAGYFKESRVLDEDGDGVMRVQSPCTEGEIMDPAAAKPADLDGDGSIELVAPVYEGCTLNNGRRWQPHLPVNGFSGPYMPTLRVLSWDRNLRTLTRRALPELDGHGAYQKKLEILDLNGDAIPEIMGLFFWGGGLYWQVWEGRSSAQPAGVPNVKYMNKRDTPLSAYPTAVSTFYRPPTETVTDENGDGRSELMQLASDGTMRSYGWTGPLGSDQKARMMFRDTGNNVTRTVELLMSYVTQEAVGWSTPSDTDFEAGSSVWRFVDINGDGLKDAFYRRMTNGQPRWEVRPNTGNGYGLPRPFGGSTQATQDINLYPGDVFVSGTLARKGADNGIRVADLNGDGRDDIILLRPKYGGDTHWSGYKFSTSPIRVMYSNGYNFDAAVELPSHGKERLWREHESNPCLNGCPENTSRFLMSAIGDFDGNGISDIAEMVSYYNGTNRQRQVMVYSLPLPGGTDRMVGVRDHMTIAETVTYDAMSSGTYRRFAADSNTPDTHTADFGSTLAEGKCVYPARCLSRGMPVVSKHQNNRAARQIANTYRYQGARGDGSGMGWLGFRSTRETDTVTGVITERTFNNGPWPSAGTASTYTYRHYPLAFKPLRTVVTVPGIGAAHAPSLSDAAGLVSTRSISWTPTYVPAGPTGEEYTYLQKAITVEAVVDMPPQFTVRDRRTEVSYDVYGNPIVHKTRDRDFAGGQPTTHETREVTTQYDNDESTWIIGLGRTVTDVRSTSRDVYATGCTTDPCSTSTRVTTYDYNATTGLMSRAHYNPGSSDLSVKSDVLYERDSAGLVTRTRRLAGERSPWVAPPACTSDSQCVSGERCLSDGAASLCRRVRDDSVQYDATGSVAEGFTNPAGHVSWRLIDPATGMLYATVDPNGRDHVIRRDGLGRPREVTGKDGSKVSTNYGAHVSTFSSSLAFGLTERNTVLDGQSEMTVGNMRGELSHKLWSTFDNQTGVARFMYDALGNLTETRYTTVAKPFADAVAALTTTLNAASTGTVVQTAKYDAAGRPVTTTEGASNTTRYDYGSHMAVGETDPNGNFRLVFRDAVGRIKEVSEYLANTAGQQLKTLYSYDEMGNLTRIAPPSASAQTLRYDILGRMTDWRITHANHYRRYAVYDSFGDVTSDQDALYERDVLGRVVARHGLGDDQRYVWDSGVGAIGNLTSARTVTGVSEVTNHETVNTYDALGRLTQRRERYKAGDSLSIGYGYDNRGRLGSIRYPEADGSGDVAVPNTGARRGPTVAYLYRNGQLESLRESSNNNAILWQATKRHVLGMIAEAKTGTGLTTAFSYYADTLRPWTQSTTGVTSGPAPNQTFVYQNNGFLASRTSNTVNETYQYDRTHRLWKYHRDPNVIDVEYKYSGAGHMTGVDMTSTTSVSDWPLADETMTHGSGPTLNTDYLQNLTVGNNPRRAYGYDEAGHLIEESEPSGQPAPAPPLTTKRTYVWNSFNLPEKITDVASNRTVTFLYDAARTRVRKTSNTGDDVAYIGQLYEKRNLPGYSTKESVYRLIADGGVVGELAHTWSSSNRASRFFFKDHQGSIAYEVTGTTSKQLGFFPFGRRMGTPPAQAFSSLGYTGHMHDDDLGLINMRGRIYHVAQRRFISEDPLLGSPFRTAGANPYVYARNNPVNLTDPTGFRDMVMKPLVVVVPRPTTPKGPLIGPPAPPRPDIKHEPIVAETGAQRNGQDSADQAGQARAQAQSQAQAEADRAAGMAGSQPPGAPDTSGDGSPGLFEPRNQAGEIAERVAGLVEAKEAFNTFEAVRSDDEHSRWLNEMDNPTKSTSGSQILGGRGPSGTPDARVASGTSPWSSQFKHADKIAKGAGAISSIFELNKLVQAYQRGDGAETAICTFKLSSEFMGWFGGPVGAAFDTGMAIGDAIAPALDFGAGSEAFLSVGQAIVEGLGIPVDHGAAK
jgi:RHS repeat-associated protein